MARLICQQDSGGILRVSSIDNCAILEKGSYKGPIIVNQPSTQDGTYPRGTTHMFWSAE
jgi:hypothetical protein